jgi:hypothetical protein
MPHKPVNDKERPRNRRQLLEKKSPSLTDRQKLAVARAENAALRSRLAAVEKQLAAIRAVLDSGFRVTPTKKK